MAVNDFNFARLNNGLDEVTAGCTKSVEALLKMANFYRVGIKNNMTSGVCPILNTAIEADDTQPELKQRGVESIKQILRRVFQLGDTTNRRCC